MAHSRERGKVAPGATAEIQQREWRGRLDVRQQRRDVLADVVVGRACAEILRTLRVVLERTRADVRQLGVGGFQ
jgi:hypothetical protein